jgi:transposase
VECGRVRVAEAVKDLGFTEKLSAIRRDWGMTANPAVRLDVLVRVGKFDPMLGAGAPLRSGGEPDLLFRALRGGFRVVNASEVWVDHLGLRKHGEESRRLVRGYAFRTGAPLFEHIRAGDAAALRVYVGFVAANARRACANLVRGKRPDGLGYLLFFVAGALEQKQAVGRSRGGRNTKIHALAAAKGRLIAILLAGGQAHDCLIAERFIRRVKPSKRMLGDKASTRRIARGAQRPRNQACHPNQPFPFNKCLYNLRWRIERAFNRLKDFRRVATRYARTKLLGLCLPRRRSCLVDLMSLDPSTIRGSCAACSTIPVIKNAGMTDLVSKAV